MLWIVFIAGMFVGANIGVVVSCIVISAKKRDAIVHQANHHVEYALMDELPDLGSKGSSNSTSQTHPIGS